MMPVCLPLALFRNQVLSGFSEAHSLRRTVVLVLRADVDQANALVIVMTLGGTRNCTREICHFEKQNGKFPSWVRTDMTNVQGWSDGLLTNVPDHQVFKLLDNHAQINQREMTQLPEFNFILLKYNKTLQKRKV